MPESLESRLATIETMMDQFVEEYNKIRQTPGDYRDDVVSVASILARDYQAMKRGDTEES